MADSKCPCAACIFDRISAHACRWVRRKWRYRASNLKRLRQEQQEINAIAAGELRTDTFYLTDLLKELENES